MAALNLVYVHCNSFNKKCSEHLGPYMKREMAIKKLTNVSNTAF